MATFESAFNYAEENAMRFLVEELGFRAVDRKVQEPDSQAVFGAATYALQSKYVRLSIAPLRLELDLTISNDLGPGYSIEELQRLIAPRTSIARTHDLYKAMYEKEQLLELFAGLVQALRVSGDRFFSGDPSLWEELAAQRSTLLQIAEDARILTLSEQAFQNKDWHRIVSLLSPIAARLPQAAAARLAYARKLSQNAT